MEKAIFPMKYLNVTQGMGGTHSHKGTLKIDLAGSDTGIDNVFAPYTGVIKKLNTADANQVWLESVKPVKYADGTEDYMTIIFAHDNSISDLKVGQTIKQGATFYQEGRKGNTTGNHVQLNVGRGKFTGDGWHKNQAGQWVINNEIDPTKALWLKNDTIIVNNGGYKWQTTDTNTDEQGTGNVTYTVKKGDTLSKIAEKYGITWQDLYAANKNIIGSNPNLIKPGQVLVIPKTNYYTVVAGDTLTSIAKRFNTTWQKIYADNKATIGNDPNLIKPGQKLIINP